MTGWRAYGGMLLIAMFWLANPPLTGLDFGIPHEGNYLLVDKNMVEFFALLILSLFPTGKYLGLAHFFKSKRKTDDSQKVSQETVRNSEADITLSSKALDRRTVIRGLSTLPFLGIFGFALFKQKQWESYEEKNLVDAVTGASAKTLNIYKVCKNLRKASTTC